MQAIYILWLRELKRYSRSRSRMIGSLGQPILFLLALGFGLGRSLLKQDKEIISISRPGIISMSILSLPSLPGFK